MRHPIDLPEGYHTTTRGQSCTRYVAVRRGLPPGRRVVGLRQVDGMPHEPRRGRETGPAGERCELVSRPLVSNQLSDNRSKGPRTSPDGDGRLTCREAAPEPCRRRDGVPGRQVIYQLRLSEKIRRVSVAQ